MPSGYVFTWTGKVSTSFDVAGNWFNESTGTTATVSPGTNDEALVTASGVISGPGTVFDLGITGTGGGLTTNGSLTGGYVFLGGTVTLASNASLGSGNLVDIGDYSSETIAEHIPTLVTVSAGANLFASNSTAGVLDILIGQDGNGTLSVTGAHAQANSGPGGIWAGNGGLGVISVANGGQVYGGGQTGQYAGYIGLALGSNGGTGSLTVTGAGSAADFGNIVDVGYGAAGVIDVTSGGSLVAGDEQTSLILGDISGTGHGTLSISGASANLYGTVYDGSYGTGDVSVSNGGSLFLNTTASNGTAGSYSMLLGAAAGSAGTLSLSSGARMTAYHGIAVGSYGAGLLTVTAATLTLLQTPGAGLTALAIGLGSGAQGSVQINGGVISDQNGAGVIVGGYGSGSLSITANGSTGGTLLTILAGGDALNIGSASGANGIVSISGTNSLLKAGSTVIDGGAGTGVLTVSSGGSLLVDGSLAATAFVAGNSGGAGSFLVSGGFATLDGQLVVGDGSSGTLSVASSGTLTVDASSEPALIIGGSAGVSGSATIATGAILSVTGEAVIGDDGTGTLAIQSGAHASFAAANGEASPGILLGASGGSSGSSGTLSIQNAFLNSATGIAVGSFGAGLLQVAGGQLTITAPVGQGLSALSAGLGAGATGVISLVGGEIDDVSHAGVVLGAYGKGSLAISSGGTLLTGNAVGDGLALGVASFSSGIATVAGTGSVLGVTGTVLDGASGTGGITVSGGATFSAGASLTATGLALGGAGGSGSFTLSDATATVTGQTQVGEYGSGTLTISGGSIFSGQASGFAALVVGSGAGATGSLLITDAGTRVSLAGGLDVGAYGNAQATLQNGASVSATAWSGNGAPSLVIEAAQGSSTLTVTGAGTALKATGEFQVGGTLGSGAGTLLVSAGATVTTALASGQSIDGATIGGTAGSAQSVASIVGTGSVWSVAGILGVGESGGSALLSVGAGGSVTAGAVAVDTNGSATLGTVVVSGTGATLNAGTLTIGNSTATGSLVVASGGTVSVAGTISVHGSVSLTDARLFSSVLTVAAGSAVTGYGNIHATSIVDLGKIGVTSGQLAFFAPITGTGSLTIGGHGVLMLTHTEAKTVGVDFAAGGGQLYALNSGQIEGNIAGWTSGDSIALRDQDVVSDSYSNGTLTLYGANNLVLGALHFTGSLATHNFSLSHPSAEQTLISFHT
jgi:T5SS/PEP-CTERM-associated repeat protein